MQAVQTIYYRKLTPKQQDGCPELSDQTLYDMVSISSANSVCSGQTQNGCTVLAMTTAGSTRPRKGISSSIVRSVVIDCTESVSCCKGSVIQ